MVGDAEGIGEAVTAGLLGNAVEPAHGEAAQDGGARCLNCGTGLQGDFCHQCGQRAHVHRSLAAIGHDLAHSVAHFEGKTWRTIPLLAWRPGELTRRYIHGERARFVSPMALFLFSVFLMFAVFSVIGTTALTPDMTNNPAEQAEFRADLAAAEEKIADLEGQRAAIARQGGEPASVESQLSEARRELEAMNVAGNVVGALEGNRPSFDVDVTGAEWLDAAYKKAKQNPSLLIYKLQANAYKFSWALIPISIPFLWLLFAFRREYDAYDHAIFVIYSISFMTLLAVTLSVLLRLGLSGGGFASAMFVIPPLHMYRQLRGAYRLSRFSATWRAVLLALFAIISATLFFLLLVAIGVS